jgi:hypothetical protein
MCGHRFTRVRVSDARAPESTPACGDGSTLGGRSIEAIHLPEANGGSPRRRRSQKELQLPCHIEGLNAGRTLTGKFFYRSCRLTRF